MDCYIRTLVVIFMLGVAGCGASMHPIEPVKTKYIEFKCEQGVNAGKALRIDVIYVTYVQELREVSRLGPKEWFKTEKREQWKFKESIVLNGGENLTVKLDPLVLKRTVLLVVFADFANELDPANQQVIVDFAGREKEVIWVERTRLQPKNEALRYVK